MAGEMRVAESKVAGERRGERVVAMRFERNLGRGSESAPERRWEVILEDRVDHR